jgi:hypothetical protein
VISQDGHDADENEVRIRYWIHNASDHVARDVSISFGKRDGTKLGSPAGAPIMNPGERVIGQVTIARSLYDATDDPRLIVTWTDDAGTHSEDRDPGALPPRR